MIAKPQSNAPDSPEPMEALLEFLGRGGAESKPLGALLVSGLPNIRYLTGFTGSSGLLLVSAEGTALFTDPRYSLQAAQQVSIPVRIVNGPLPRAVAAYIERRKWKRVGFERNRISFELFDALRTALTSSRELVAIDEAVEELRMRKTSSEIARIRQSVATNSRAFRRALKALRPGIRESELAAEIDYQQRRAGAESPAFETIVASGARSALPHARPTEAKIGHGGILLIDMGSFENGYASDMTRTLYMGKAPKRFKMLYKAVLEAQLAAVDAVRPGVAARRIDLAARAVLEKHGFGKEFLHSTGHGLGLEIHELPRIGKKSGTILQTGFAITIEPGAYFEGYGGVRIEDTVLVTEGGCEVLTPTPKELVEW